MQDQLTENIHHPFDIKLKNVAKCIVCGELFHKTGRYRRVCSPKCSKQISTYKVKLWRKVRTNIPRMLRNEPTTSRID